MLLVFSSIFVAVTKILGYNFVAPLGEAKWRNVEIKIFKSKKKKKKAQKVNIKMATFQVVVLLSYKNELINEQKMVLSFNTQLSKNIFFFFGNINNSNLKKWKATNESVNSFFSNRAFRHF